MNDFTEIEEELKKLRPAVPGPHFLARVEQAMLRAEAVPTAGVLKPPHPTSRRPWLALGLGLASAALLLLLARIEVTTSKSPAASVSPSPEPIPAPRLASTARPQFIPAGLTQVVYETRDEGLVFAANSPDPMRRLRRQSRETLQWRNPQTGASLRVSYPAEQVELLPISGQ